MPGFLRLPLKEQFAVAGNWLYKKTHTKPVDLAPLFTRVPRWNKKIPNQVFLTWRETRFTPLHALQIKKFRQLNHDFSFEFYDDRRMNEYMDTHYADHPIRDVFHYIKIMASKVDVWRYCVLYREGGVYCDIDSSLTLPLRTLLKDDPEEMLSYEGNRWKDLLEIGKYADPALFLTHPSDKVVGLLDQPENTFLTWFLCFAPGNPILKEYIDLLVRHFPFYKDKVFEGVLPATNHFTGPAAVTQAVWRTLDKTGKTLGQFGTDFKGYGQYKTYGSEDRLAPGEGYMTLGNMSLGGKGQ